MKTFKQYLLESALGNFHYVFPGDARKQVLDFYFVSSLVPTGDESIDFVLEETKRKICVPLRSIVLDLLYGVIVYSVNRYFSGYLSHLGGIIIYRDSYLKDKGITKKNLDMVSKLSRSAQVSKMGISNFDLVAPAFTKNAHAFVENFQKGNKEYTVSHIVDFLEECDLLTTQIDEESAGYGYMWIDNVKLVASAWFELNAQNSDLGKMAAAIDHAFDLHHTKGHIFDYSGTKKYDVVSDILDWKHSVVSPFEFFGSGCSMELERLAGFVLKKNASEHEFSFGSHEEFAANRGAIEKKHKEIKKNVTMSRDYGVTREEDDEDEDEKWGNIKKRALEKYGINLGKHY